jgi:hypothetical protein
MDILDINSVATNRFYSLEYTKQDIPFDNNLLTNYGKFKFNFICYRYHTFICADVLYVNNPILPSDYIPLYVDTMGFNTIEEFSQN